MRRKRNRIRPRWAPIFAVILVANLTAALCYSPFTALRRVRVEGAQPWDQARLTRLMADLAGIPCAQINPALVEGSVLSLPDAATAHLMRNLFGSAVLTIRYREPVAVMDEGEGRGVPRSRGEQRDRPSWGHGMVLSADGVLYSSDHIPPGLPTVQLLPGQPEPMLTLAADWQILKIATLAVKARQMDTRNPLQIQLKRGNIVCLNMGAGQVILGSCEDLDAKLGVLRRQLAEDPDYLSKISALDLTVPTAPSVVPKPTGEHS